MFANEAKVLFNVKLALPVNILCQVLKSKILQKSKIWA